MKHFFGRSIAIAVLITFGLSVSASDIYKGTHYQGIGKIKGEAVDAWIDMMIDDGDMDFNMSNALACTVEYTVGETAANPTMTVHIPGSGAVSFKTTDGGESLTGSFTRLGQKIDAWLLKVPVKLDASTMPDGELDEIVGSADGYTAFVTIEMPDGRKACVTSEFMLSVDDHSYQMICDSPSVQKIFGSMKGKYRVQNGSLILTNSTTKTATGTIYDNGKYIEVPMGSGQGYTLNLILIR